MLTGIRNFMRLLFGGGESAAAPAGAAAAAGDDDSREPAPPPVPRPDLAPVYELIGQLQGEYQQMAHPDDLIRLPGFRRGSTFFCLPGFTAEALVTYGKGDNDLLALMALDALLQDEPQPGLMSELIPVLGYSAPWRHYFIYRVLDVHRPAPAPVVGEAIHALREYYFPRVPVGLEFLKDFVNGRLAGGEAPTFGPIRADLNAEKVGELRTQLQQLAHPGLAPLADELQAWQDTSIDLELLRGAGRIWGERHGAAEAPPIDHAALRGHVQTLLTALGQSPRRSVLITGEQGVGKTAVVQAAAARLQDDGWLVFEASGQELVAGQRYVGDFEERLQQIIGQLGGNRRAVWYAPDFASLLWAGTHDGSRSAALDMLLPHVEKGDLVLVGEMRPEKLELTLQLQPRLLTTFDVVRVDALDEEQTLDLARRWIAAASPADGPPLLDDEVLTEAWLLALQYLQGRATPGRLLEFLDEARRRVLKASEEPLRVTSDDLVTTLAAQTGLPVELLDDRRALDPRHLRDFFTSRIMGQPEAIECLVERITMMKAGLTDPTRPQGVYLFAGPTGTGKTEIAKTLSRYLFGTDERLIRLDMSEFQTPDAIKRLTGDGSDQDHGSLAFRVRRQPFSTILLDEFEKAHERIWDLFLQVFDDGRLTDARGATTDFRHTLIILTSNLGAHAPVSTSVGFGEDDETFRPRDVDKAITRAFRPEFINRLDQVVVFRPFTRETMRRILEKELHDLQQRRGLRNRTWAVVWEDSALDFLLEKGFSATLGARPLRRAIEKYLLAPLAAIIVERRFPDGDQFLYIHAVGDRLRVEFIDPDLPEESAAATEPEPKAAGAAERGVRPLQAIALNPRGTATELESLRNHHARLAGKVAAPAWQKEKETALAMMSEPEFWSSAERFTILGEVEYRDRIETGLGTAAALLARTSADNGGPRDRFPGKLVGQAAARLHLLDWACRALDGGQPWEALVLVEGRPDPGVDAELAADPARRLGRMYRQWAERRKMQLAILHERPAADGTGYRVLLAISGYAAYPLLAGEEGLHVWELAPATEERGRDLMQVLVRVAPQPPEFHSLGAAGRVDAARRILTTPRDQAPTVVRNYRELPDPLVRDRVAGWRTGRLDRVLAGEFDLYRQDREAAGA